MPYRLRRTLPSSSWPGIGPSASSASLPGASPRSSDDPSRALTPGRAPGAARRAAPAGSTCRGLRFLRRPLRAARRAPGCSRVPPAGGARRARSGERLVELALDRPLPDRRPSLTLDLVQSGHAADHVLLQELNTTGGRSRSASARRLRGPGRRAGPPRGREAIRSSRFARDGTWWTASGSVERTSRTPSSRVRSSTSSPTSGAGPSPGWRPSSSMSVTSHPEAGWRGCALRADLTGVRPARGRPVTMRPPVLTRSPPGPIRPPEPSSASASRAAERRTGQPMPLRCYRPAPRAGPPPRRAPSAPPPARSRPAGSRPASPRTPTPRPISQRHSRPPTGRRRFPDGPKGQDPGARARARAHRPPGDRWRERVGHLGPQRVGSGSRGHARSATRRRAGRLVGPDEVADPSTSAPTRWPSRPSPRSSSRPRPISGPRCAAPILFTRGGDVYAASGKDLEQLTSDGSELIARVVAGRQRIYFIRTKVKTTNQTREPGKYTFYIPNLMRMDADGKKKKTVYDSLIKGRGGLWFSHVLQPDVSPDGKTDRGRQRWAQRLGSGRALRGVVEGWQAAQDGAPRPVPWANSATTTRRGARTARSWPSRTTAAMGTMVPRR